MDDLLAQLLDLRLRFRGCSDAVALVDGWILSLARDGPPEAETLRWVEAEVEALHSPYSHDCQRPRLSVQLDLPRRAPQRRRMRPLHVIRLLTAAAVLLAAGCVGLAWAWSDQRAAAACWQEAFESGDPPPAGVC
jgi:hypothetical protein